MFSSRVMSLAREAGIDMKVVGSRSALCEQVAKSSSALALIDLEHREASMREIIDDFSAFSHKPKIVVYGPHVKVSLLDDAQAAGADLVLTRGQFDKQVGSLLQTLASPTLPETP
jgi:hypothetical protein